MIELKGITKDFGSFRAVDQISFQVPKGQVLGFLGPNGAGKSTTMKMLTGFLEPTQGTARVLDKDILEDSIAVRRLIGYLPESAPSYGEMTVEEFLQFVGEMRSLGGSALQKALSEVQERCFLKEVWFQPIETLSKGYRQRVGFAQALIHNPPVLVLDEPTDGLDPNQKHEVRRLIKDMSEDKTIILSTHILEEVEAVCERAVIIASGQLVADATPSELMEKSRMHNAITLSLGTASEVDELKNALTQVNEVKGVDTYADVPHGLRVYPNEGRLILGRVSDVVRERNVNVQKIHVEKGRLDEVFRDYTLPH